MQIRWSRAAAEDLVRIVDYIRQENVPAARRIAQSIYDSAASLRSFPHKGRTGRVDNTRELPIPSLPFVVVYRVLADVVEIANVIHGAQRWPPKE
jgi:toxin ParE1/3/4